MKSGKGIAGKLIKYKGSCRVSRSVFCCPLQPICLQASDPAVLVPIGDPIELELLKALKTVDSDLDGR
jgi:hypothetical protein